MPTDYSQRYPLKENRPPDLGDFIKKLGESAAAAGQSTKTAKAARKQNPTAKKPVSVHQEHALSVRQPFAELIMRGVKKIEYRSINTKIRGRVYIYASKKPGPDVEFKKLGAKPGDFDIGVLIGTVEVVGCTKPKHSEEFEWQLANPERLSKPVKPHNKAQPVWFIPFNI